jgi:hypothetical protein
MGASTNCYGRPWLWTFQNDRHRLPGSYRRKPVHRP